MEAAQFSGRVGVSNDLPKLTPLLQQNCQRMQYDWNGYLAVAEKILTTPTYGFFIVVEDSAQQVAGLAFFTFEWSDWRDGAFFWL